MTSPSPTPRSRRAVPAGVLGLVAATALVLSGCFPTPTAETEKDQGGSGTTSSGAPVAPEGIFAEEAMAEYVSQELQWDDCQDLDNHGTKLECATLKAPLDYEDPAKGNIEVVMARTMPAGNSAPSRHLLTNPGGPGSSGVDFLSWAADNVFSHEMNEEFRLTSFDPRGVQRSTPVRCLTDEQIDEQRAEPQSDPQDLDWDQALREAEEEVESCREKSGPIVDHMDTVSAAHDMELMRLVLGQEKLDYLGFSYGTALGSRYAELFPTHVGAMVLDGGMDPSLSGRELSAQQMEGFVSATRDWASYCINEADDCPFTGSVDDALKDIQQRLESLDESPVTSGGRTVNGVTWLDGFIVPLYDKDMWPTLVDAYRQDAVDGSPAMMLQLADLNYDRNPDGTYASNLVQAFAAVNCADYGGPAFKDELVGDYRALTEASPLFGRYFISTSLFCTAWPHQAENAPSAVKAAGSPDIVVVGTTGDPATPYRWSQALAEQLENGTLVTYEGFGHTAYGKSNCVDAAIEGFLIDGTVPADGKTCQS
ncbi:alpha/beta hydrolase [Micrococcoides hystricis]|uniref:Alpha/beta hydrolase n=1 Tax=Micrococcoides hystricis TaxID=1572761 RepID=A0ABV6PAW9_9MICC